MEFICNRVGYKLVCKMVQYLSYKNKKEFEKIIMKKFDSQDNSIKQRLLNIKDLVSY